MGGGESRDWEGAGGGFGFSALTLPYYFVDFHIHVLL